MARSPQVSYCTLEQEVCLEEVAGMPDGCLVSCGGLYADIQHVKGATTTEALQLIIGQYNAIKDEFSKNILFDPAAKHLSK